MARGDGTDGVRLGQAAVNHWRDRTTDGLQFRFVMTRSSRAAEGRARRRRGNQRTAVTDSGEPGANARTMREPRARTPVIRIPLEALEPMDRKVRVRA